MNTLLDIDNVTKIYKIRKGLFKRKDFYALKNISFAVFEKEILGVVGESGSGKTTMAKLILRLEKPTGGRINYRGYNIWEMGKNYTKEVSVIFQDPRNSLNPRMRVQEILEEPLLVHRFPNRKEAILKVMSMVSLPEEFLLRKPAELSGGQRQRVAIARAIVLNPKIIVADEPTSSLDVSIQMDILNLFTQMRSKGITIVLITHDIRVIEKISDRTVVMYGGMLMEAGKTEEVLTEPMHPYTVFLLSNVPVNDPRKRGTYVWEEYEYDIPEVGCPFVQRCEHKKEECTRYVRRVELNGRFVNCNLY